MSGVILRDARSTDAGRVGAILSAFIDETDWMPRIHTRAEDLAHAGDLIDRGWVRVAETAEGVAGFIARDETRVHALYMSAAAQGRGIGAQLLHEAQAEVSTLDLWTFAANSGAQRFYEREGFHIVERTDGAGNDEGLPDIRYHWTRDAESDGTDGQKGAAI